MNKNNLIDLYCCILNEKRKIIKTYILSSYFNTMRFYGISLGIGRYSDNIKQIYLKI